EKKAKQELLAALNKRSQKKLDLELIIKKVKAKTLDTGPVGPLFTPPRDEEIVVKEKQLQAGLTPKYTFENYILGGHNNLAHAIAVAVATRPGEQYNPVFFHSGVGLGKTHLLQAIGNNILRNHPATKIIYTTGETFTNELIDAIQSGKAGKKSKYTTNEFRNRYRHADVFLIDDVQFIIGKDATQEELFHTFNSLYMSGKQIVITSDRPPSEFKNLASRITSRFAMGIIADIHKPGFEERVAILRARRDFLGEDISDEIISYIAQNISSNIRELEGAYMQVSVKAHSNNMQPTVTMAAEALGQSYRETKKPTVNINEVLKAVCNYYSVNIPDIKGPRRHKEIVIPRQVAMYLMKEFTETPYIAIGDLLGGRDHTTIMHGAEKIHQKVTEKGKIYTDVANIKQTLGY
ncbi:chromosomal replication initiator protein DnaA, partial [candidate division WWE3 bacterium RIFOXYC2_FULL_40_11]